MKHFYLTLLALSVFFGYGQKSFRVSGYVEDASLGETLPEVHVLVKGRSTSTLTDSSGFYSLSLPSGEYELQFSFLGYEKLIKKIDLRKDLVLNVELRQAFSELQEVSVKAKSLPAEAKSNGTLKLSVAEIERIPPLLGEVDVVKALQYLPGVQGGVEGSSGFFVRGGSIDQNLILLDGIPIYNASHLLGLFSVFNSDVIEDVSITKGGFPARFGGRLSSILEVDLKDGNFQEYSGEGAISLVAPKISFSGPIVKGKTAFVVSGRRCIYDWIVEPFIPDEEQVLYYFGDLNAKITHYFNENNKLSLNYFHSIDRYSSRFSYSDLYENQYGLDWKNNLVSLNWEHKAGENLRGNFKAFLSEYNFNTLSDNRDSAYSYIIEYNTRILDQGLKYDLLLTSFEDHDLRTGFAYTYHVFQPGAFQTKLETDLEQDFSYQRISEDVYSHDFSLYAEDDWRISPKWRINAGLHYALYRVQSSTYPALQPRLEVEFSPRTDWSWSASYSKMTQFLHLLSSSGLGLPTDLWVSSTDMVPPQQSQQVSFGSQKFFDDETYLINTQLFYKSMTDLIAYKEGASYTVPTDWQYLVETGGTGEAYGLEVLLKKQKGPTTGWISYTLSRSTRRFEFLNDGETFPHRYDRTHDVSVILNHKFSEKIDVGLTWVYSTGLAFSAAEAEIFSLFYFSGFFGNLQYDPKLYYSDRNAHRYPDYHRLDLGINFRKKTSWGSRVLNVSLYNTYSRINAFFIYPRKEDGRQILTKVGLFPILPSVSYSFKF